MARILLTGAGGYLGSETMLSLRRHGFEAIGLIRGEQTRGAQAGLVTCDLLDRHAVREVIADIAPDRIVHAAAYVPQTASAYNDEDGARKSLQMIENLLAATTDTPLLYVSSMTVYGGKGSVVRREDDAGSPESPYGKGKWLGEQMIRESGRDCIAVRLPGLFGGGRAGGLVGNLLHAFRSGEEPMLPTQPILWAAMDVRDAADGIARIAHASPFGYFPVNLGYPDTHSISRLVEIIASIFHRAYDYDQTHPDFEFDLSRARTLGAETETNLREAVVRLVRELE